MSSRICNNCNMQVSENARYCSGCGSDLTREPEISSKKQNPPSVIKSAKKGFGIGTKIGFGIGAIFFLILIIGAIAGSSNTSTTTGSNINNQQPTTIQEQSSSSNDSSSQGTITNDEIISKVEGHQAITASNSGTTSEQQAIAFVQQYRGSSGTGYSISQIITLVVDIAYSGENILNNPSTEHGWTATKEYSENGNVWIVEFYFKTYRENIKIVWYANMDTHSVYSGDTTAKSILDMTNIPSGSVTNSTLSQIHLT